MLLHYTGNGMELKSHNVKLKYDTYYEVDATLYNDLRQNFPAVCKQASRNGQEVIKITVPQSVIDQTRDKIISQNAMSRKSFFG